MIENRLITVVLDPTVIRDPVIDRAKMLARSTGAKFEILINCHSVLNEKSYFDIDNTETGEYVNETLQEGILQSLRGEFSFLKEPISINLFDSTDVADTIIERVAKTGADLVLKSTHHHSDLRKSILTNTDWKLIRQCPVPLWFSKAGAWLTRGKIVASIDPLHSRAEQMQLDSLLINYAEHFARLSQQSAGIFHAFYGEDESRPIVHVIKSEAIELKRQHNQAVYRLLASHNIDPSNVRIDIGDVSEKLLAYLGEIRSNLLIIGALSRSKLERAIVGNTAEKILDESPCDLLVVKPELSQ